MSSPYALAAVTAVLRSRLTISLAASGVPSSVGGVSVTALTPDRILTGAQEGNSINLFLHHVSRNQGWANVGPPPRSEGGDLVANPPLGVDLHYVVSAYGQDPLTAEILLGHVVTAFHDEPVLTRGAIQRALTPNPPDPSVPAALGSSRLADQVESLRVTATTPGTEEVARVWAAFQAPYRPSVFYDVSVVLLDGMARATSAFPVRMVGVGTTDVVTPEIDDVVAQGAPGAPIDVDATLVVTGSALAGPGVRVRLGGSSAEPDVDGSRTLARRGRRPAPARPRRAPRPGRDPQRRPRRPTGPAPGASSSAFPVALRPVVTFGGGAVQVAVDGHRRRRRGVVGHDHRRDPSRSRSRPTGGAAPHRGRAARRPVPPGRDAARFRGERCARRRRLGRRDRVSVRLGPARRLRRAPARRRGREHGHRRQRRPHQRAHGHVVRSP